MSNGRPHQIRVELNVNDLEPLLCPHCGGAIFDSGLVLLRRIGAMQSPQGKPMTLKMEVVACLSCDGLYRIEGDNLKPVFETKEPDNSAKLEV